MQNGYELGLSGNPNINSTNRLPRILSTIAFEEHNSFTTTIVTSLLQNNIQVILTPILKGKFIHHEYPARETDRRRKSNGVSPISGLKVRTHFSSGKFVLLVVNPVRPDILTLRRP